MKIMVEWRGEQAEVTRYTKDADHIYIKTMTQSNVKAMKRDVIFIDFFDEPAEAIVKPEEATE